MIIPLYGQELILDQRVRGWCKNRYHNHPKGCPNYGKRATCPPQAPQFENFIDIKKPMLLVVVSFKLKNHIENMRLKHPNWSEYQLRCVLYWQGGVRATLKKAVAEALKVYPDMISTDCPEAMGVHVIKTAKKWFDIKMIPSDMAYKIAICGYSVATPKDKDG